jgi:ABC-type polysaccharide/polyol phosphate export permease
MFAAAREIAGYRELLATLTWRDVRVRYKQSALGIAWAVLLPLSLMLVFTFVFTRAIDAASLLRLEAPYALYAYVGLVPWTFFSVALGNCTNSLVANRNLVTKVYFPREVFPLSCVGAALVDFLIAWLVLGALAAYFQLTGQWSVRAHPALMLVPLIALIQIGLTAGLGMMLAMANLFYRDVRHVFGVVIQLAMFTSGVVVPLPEHGGWMVGLLWLNPLVPVITAYRDCLLYGRWPEAAPLLYAAAATGAILVVGWGWFRRASYRFAECI